MVHRRIVVTLAADVVGNIVERVAEDSNWRGVFGHGKFGLRFRLRIFAWVRRLRIWLCGGCLDW